MFERFTEKARRVIFFARYEASQYGSQQIESEHILLGLLRENRAILAPPRAKLGLAESLRRSIEQHATIREQTSTSVDLPLSNECKRILAYSAEEATALGHLHIGTEHLLLGLLHEQKCLAAKLLADQDVHLKQLREQIQTSPNGESLPQKGDDDVVYTPESRTALRFAREEAKSLDGHHVGTEHLLLGVLRANIFAAKLLAERGLTVEMIREELSRRDSPPG